MTEVSVVTDALRAEAKRWQTLSDELAKIQQAADQLDLAITAFFALDESALFGALAVLQPEAAAHSRTYNDFQGSMTGLLGTGATEFDEMATALVKIANAYDASEEKNAEELGKVYLDLEDIF
jgi:hypothetical protein